MIKNTFVISNVKVNFKALMPMFLFIEDIWPYQFHSGIQYTKFMEQCMVETNFLTTIKYSPSVMHRIESVSDSTADYLEEKN